MCASHLPCLHSASCVLRDRRRHKTVTGMDLVAVHKDCKGMSFARMLGHCGEGESNADLAVERQGSCVEQSPGDTDLLVDSLAAVVVVA
jgi:hypothetical protein